MAKCNQFTPLPFRGLIIPMWLLCTLKGKKKCVAMSKQILKVLIDLLEQDSDEVLV